jgi:DNA-binding IclR family transcriptional regulator
VSEVGNSLAPSVSRIAVLPSFLRAAPTNWFTLAELHRALGLSKTTLASTIGELVRHQYLVRREGAPGQASSYASYALGRS